MADTPEPKPLSEKERQQLAELVARDTAEQQKTRDAATRVVADLVNSPEFKALFPLAKAANAAAPLDTQVQHLALMMTYLSNRSF